MILLRLLKGITFILFIVTLLPAVILTGIYWILAGKFSRIYGNCCKLGNRIKN